MDGAETGKQASQVLLCIYKPRVVFKKLKEKT